MTKVTKTFTIDEDVWNKYSKIAKKTSINKSLDLENHMRDVIYVNENPGTFTIIGDVELLKYKTKI